MVPFIISSYYIIRLKSCLNQLALSALRSCIAAHTLQECLQHRDQLAAEIKNYMSEHTTQWGTEVSNIVIKDMQRHLSAKAIAERETAAKVIEAKGEVEAADTLNTPAALQIRYLETMKAMAQNQGTKVIFVPMAVQTGQSDNITGIVAAMEGFK